MHFIGLLDRGRSCQPLGLIHLKHNFFLVPILFVFMCGMTPKEAWEEEGVSRLSQQATSNPVLQLTASPPCLLGLLSPMKHCIAAPDVHITTTTVGGVGSNQAVAGGEEEEWEEDWRRRRSRELEGAGARVRLRGLWQALLGCCLLLALLWCCWLMVRIWPPLLCLSFYGGKRAIYPV